MRRPIIIAAGLLAGLAVIAAVAGLWRLAQPAPTARSPYAGQESSPVRGLSAQEVDDLLNGRGAGFARTAELNSYPGPRHVLDVKEQLRLSPEQTARVEAVFARMETDARRLGREVVEHEARLSTAFASGAITEADLRAQTAALAGLYGELRAVHLRAHLEITPLLSPEQITRYNALRGYGDTPAQASPAPQHKGHHP